MPKQNIASLLITAACAVASIAVVVLSSSFFMLAAGKPATIYGPSVAPMILDILVALGVILFAVTLFRRTGRAARVGAFAAWLVILSISTHRIVDIGPDGLTDIWLGVPLATDVRWEEIDHEPHNCQLLLLPGVCFTRGGNKRYIPTVFPFTRMSTDGRDHLVPVNAVANQPSEV